MGPCAADDARRHERRSAAEAAAGAHQDNNEGCSEHAHAPLPAGLRLFLLASSVSSRLRRRYSSPLLAAVSPWCRPARPGVPGPGGEGAPARRAVGAASRGFVLQGHQITARPIFFPSSSNRYTPTPLWRPAPPRRPVLHTRTSRKTLPVAPLSPDTLARPHAFPAARRHAVEEAK